MKKLLRYSGELALIIGVAILLIYCNSHKNNIYEGVSLGHPVFSENVAAPADNIVTMAACDGERIYLLQGGAGIVGVYGTGGQLLGTYVFCEDSVNGSFTICCDAGITYVFDKGGDLYILDALELTEYKAKTPQLQSFRRNMEHCSDEYITRFDSRGVWIKSDDGEVLALPTPAAHITTTVVYSLFAIGISYALWARFRTRREGRQ